MKGKGIVFREPSVVDIRNDSTKRPLAVGAEAKQMMGRTPEDVVACYPYSAAEAESALPTHMLNVHIRSF